MKRPKPEDSKYAWFDYADLLESSLAECVCKGGENDLHTCIDMLRSQLAEKEKEILQWKQWINDLQSGMYINCVYCGHRYGPKKDTPVAMADILKEHIEQCPKHPMSKLKKEIDRLREGLEYLSTFQCDNPVSCGQGAICNSCWVRGWAEKALKGKE